MPTNRVLNHRSYLQRNATKEEEKKVKEGKKRGKVINEK
jgi:hypothetical protein